MVYWNRFISYIYRYHGGRKCENVGFAKVAKSGRTCRLTIGIRDGMSRCDEVYNVYIYRETIAGGDELSPADGKTPVMIPLPVYVGRLALCGGRGEESFTFDWENADGSRRPITAFAGIIIRRAGGSRGDGTDGKVSVYAEDLYSSDLFCSSWTDSVVDYNRQLSDGSLSEENLGAAQAMASFVPAGTEYGCEMSMDKPSESGCGSEVSWRNSEENGSEVLRRDTEEDGSDCEASWNSLDESGSEAMESNLEENGSAAGVPMDRPAGSEAAIDNMFETYERLPLLPVSVSDISDGSVIESVRITPNDIGLLDMCNWKLGVNSFLTHGFYNYKYLMLGKVIFVPAEGSVSYILGVPGVYSAREKYLANIFGFERFVPERETHIKTGSFGYWVTDIR